MRPSRMWVASAAGPYAGPERAQVRMAVLGEEDAVPVSGRCSRPRVASYWA
jgi:hypothetical protein